MGNRPGDTSFRISFWSLGLLITAVFSYYVWRTSKAQDLARFNASAQELTTYVRGRPRLYIEVLRAGTGLFAVSPSINPSQFHNFVERLELRDQYPGAQGIGFLERVKANQKNSIETIQRQRGLTDFKIWPDQNQEEYFPVVYFEPLDGQNPVDVGFDMQTDPVRRAAMENARDAGLPTATARVMLPRENDQKQEPGFLIYVPIYEHDSVPRDTSERREALSGFVYCQFRASDFIKSVLAIKNTSDIDIRLYDGPQPADENLFYQTAAAGADSSLARFTASSTVEVAGRTWTIAFASHPAFISATNRNVLYFAAIVGVIISLLLFALTRLQVRARGGAERAASELRAFRRKSAPNAQRSRASGRGATGK